MSQPPLFETTSPSSSLIGTKIRLSRADTCCSNFGTINPSSKAMHAASLHCATCGAFRGWLSTKAVDFIITTRAKFGASDITLRSPPSRTSPGAGGEGH